MTKVTILGNGETSKHWRHMTAAEKKLANDTNWGKLEALTAFATDHGHTILDLALSWLASQTVVSSVIAGATSPDQVSGNVAATQAWALSAEEMGEVDSLLQANS